MFINFLGKVYLVVLLWKLYLFLSFLCRTNLCPVSYRWVNIYRLHFCGLLGGSLLLYVLKTEAHCAAADEILSPKLPDGDFTHDLDLHQLEDSIKTIQYCD